MTQDTSPPNQGGQPGRPRSFADDLAALRNELRLGRVEIEGLLKGGPRFGGQVLDRVFKRLSSSDWHIELENVVPRIHKAALSVHVVKAAADALPNPRRNIDAVTAMRDAQRFLDDFCLDVEMWLDDVRHGRIPTAMPRSTRARAFVAADRPAEGRAN